MASDRKLNIYNEDNVTINVVEESDNQLTIINESPTVEVITIYEQGPQGPRGEKGEGADLPTEIISGSGANNLLALFVNSGYITGSKNLSFDGSQLSVTGSIDGLSHIDFSTSSYSTNAPARITWNPDFGTLDLGVVGGNVNLSWGLEVAAYVVNGEADTLVDGEVVYMSGSRGDKPKVYRASSLTELTSTKTFGVVTEPISSNQLGYVTTQGVVNGLNLSSFNPGDAVWLGTTPGTFTATKPQAPTHSVFVGIVQRANAGDGQLYVRVQNGYEIDELHNVRITNPLNGQLLTYNQAQQIWVNGNTLSGSYFVSGSIQATAFTGSLLGTASYADIIRSGGVLGSGGANQVAFWSGTGSLTGNSLMLVESANNRFRIGNIYYGTSGITTTQGGSAASIFMSSANRNINMDGNVGIGTSPVAVLHVSGSSGSGLFEIDSNSSQNILFVSGSGNVGINTNTPAYKLDVIGTGRFRGVGSTGATTAFLVQNSAGTTALQIYDDTRVVFPPSNTRIELAGNSSAQHIKVDSNISPVEIRGRGNIVGNYTFYMYTAETSNRTTTTNEENGMLKVSNHSFTPNSGNVTYNILSINAVVSQSGTATGTSRGIYLAPVLTSAADWRSIEWSNNSGYGLYGRGTAPNFLSGSLTLANGLTVTGSINTSVYSGSSAYISGDVYVGGKVTAQEFYTQYVSSSIIYQSGSTKFGDSLDDIHQRTGSMSVTGSVNIAGMLTAHSYSGSSMMLSGNMYSSEYIISGSDSIITGSSKISNWYDSGDSFYVGSQATVPEGVFFNDTGTKMYIVDSTADRIYAYDLSTPWTLSSAVYNNEFSPLLSTYEGTPTDLYIKPDGTKLWIIGNTSDRVVEYNLPTPWLVSSMTFVKFISVVNEDSAATGLYFSLDGTKMYIVGTTNDRIYQYNLSAAWDIATAVVGNNLSVTNICSAPQSIDFSNDGSYLYLIGSNSDIIVEYYLSVPWELSSAVYSGQSVTITGLESFPRGVFFADDSKKVFYVGSTGDIVKSLNADNQLRFQTSASSFSGTVVFEKGLDVPLNQYASFFGPVYANQTLYVNGASTFIGAMVSTGITNNSSITSTNDTNLSTGAGRPAYIANTAASNTQNVEILNNSTWGGTKNLRVLSGASGSINNFYIGGTSGGQVNIYSYAGLFEHSGYLTIGSNLKVAGQTPRIDSVYNIVTGSTIFYDTFTEASNTLLDAHVPDLGSSWNLTFSNSATATVTVRGGLGQMGPTISVGDRGSYYLTDTTSSFNDYQITTTIQLFDSSDDVVWVLFRWQDDNNYYAIRWSSSIGQVLKKVAGVWTSLGNAITLSTGTNTTLMVRVFGSNIIIFQNGRWSGTFVDTDITSGGYFGIGFGNIGYISGDDFDSTWQINEFKVEEIDYNIAVTTFESFYDKHYFESGNVGIGSINPIAKLHVSGSSGSGLFKIDSDSVQNIIYVSGSGNVGINTNNLPFAKFEVQSLSADESYILYDEAASTGTGTNWSGTSFASGYTHTVGSTAALTATGLTVSNNTFYLVTYTITGRTAGTVDISIGGQSTGAVSTGASFFRKTSSTATLTVTPTTDFNGTVTVSVKQLLMFGTLSEEKLTTATGTGWSGTGYSTGYTHSTGFTTALTAQNLSLTDYSYYIVSWTVTNRTAGSFYISFGNHPQYSITTSGWNLFGAVSGNFTIVPTSDFNGTVSVSAKRINPNKSHISLKNASGSLLADLKINPYDPTNLAIGYEAGYNHGTGVNNTYIGFKAGKQIINANNNTIIGAGFDTTFQTDRTLGTGGSNLVLIGSNIPIPLGSRNVLIGNNMGAGGGNLGTSVIIGDYIGVGLSSGGSNVVIGAGAATNTGGGNLRLTVLGAEAPSLGDSTTNIGNPNATWANIYGNLTLGTVTAKTSTRAFFQGQGTTSATFGLQVHNSTGTNNGLVVRDDGRVGINTTLLTAELTVNGGVSATVLTASNTGGIFFPNSLFRIYKPGSYLGHEYSMDWSMRDGHVFTKNSTTSIGMTSGNIRNLSSQGGINLDSAGNANYYPLFISYAIANTSNQTGNATGIYLRANESSLRGMSHNLIDLGNASGSIFNITNRGVAYISSSLGIGTNNPAYTLDVSGTGRFTNGIIVSGSTTTIGDLIVTGSVTSTTGFTGSYKGDISPQSTINGNPVIDMYTAIAFSVAL